MKSETPTGRADLRTWAAAYEGFEVRDSQGLVGWLEGVALIVRPDEDHEPITVPLTDVRAVVPECHQILIG